MFSARLFLKSPWGRKILTRISGTARNQSGCQIKALLKSSCKAERYARVMPHPGQGNPVMFRIGQPHVNTRTIIAAAKRPKNHFFLFFIFPRFPPNNPAAPNGPFIKKNEPFCTETSTFFRKILPCFGISVNVLPLTKFAVAVMIGNMSKLCGSAALRREESPSITGQGSC